jgi:hypothetical protein
MISRVKTFLEERITTVISLLICILLLTGFCFACDSVSRGNIRRQRDTLLTSLERDITGCYAENGFYPSSLQYIKDNYGLYYDEELFYVDYQILGSNIRPDVSVIELDRKNN